MRILITGVTGFAGRHLAHHFANQTDSSGTACHQIFGFVRKPAEDSEGCTCYTPLAGDLLDPDSIARALEESRPDIVFHLAGQADVGRSWRIPARTIEINTLGTLHLLEAMRHTTIRRLIAVTTADLYGVQPADAMPITEDSIEQPYHPYAISKLAASHLLKVYAKQVDFDIIEARPFNHIGIGQALGFVVPDFASQIAAIKHKQISRRMLVGNLNAERDFTDVRDIARAYDLLATNGLPGESYLVCSGQPIPIHYLLTTLAEIAGTEIEIEYDPNRMRPSDTPVLYGSNLKIYLDTGWRPEIHLRQTLESVLAEWESKVIYGE